MCEQVCKCHGVCGGGSEDNLRYCSAPSTLRQDLHPVHPCTHLANPGVSGESPDIIPHLLIARKLQLCVLQTCHTFPTYIQIWHTFPTYIQMWHVFLTYIQIWHTFLTCMHTCHMFLPYIQIWHLFFTHMQIWHMFPTYIQTWHNSEGPESGCQAVWQALYTLSEPYTSRLHVLKVPLFPVWTQCKHVDPWATFSCIYTLVLLLTVFLVLAPWMGLQGLNSINEDQNWPLQEERDHFWSTLSRLTEFISCLGPAHGSVWDPPELELQQAVSCLPWVLGHPWNNV